MAKNSDMLLAGIFLITNTLVIFIYDLIGGPLFGSVFNVFSIVDLPQNPNLTFTSIQWIPSFFFLSLIIIELVLIIRLAAVVVSRVNYQGETEF